VQHTIYGSAAVKYINLYLYSGLKFHKFFFMKKPVLFFLAVVLFVFYNYGLYQWIQSGHDFKDVWQATTSDWFLAITVLDMALFSLLCLIWLYRDMSKRNFSDGKKFLILLASLITGVVVLLAYLAFRKNDHLK
jgi:cbb3-type cytochrome oxidase subunit 3